MSEKEIESKLRGTTLRVYWYLLEHGSESDVSVRKIQRALGFSSPTLSVYHLEKLADLGLLEKRQGEYHVVREVKAGILKQFIRVGTVMLPRYVFYATLFTTLLMLFAAYLSGLGQISLSSIFALIFGILGTLMSWYECIRIWRQKP
jgi:hypothetical protein